MALSLKSFTNLSSHDETKRSPVVLVQKELIPWIKFPVTFTLPSSANSSTPVLKFVDSWPEEIKQGKINLWSVKAHHCVIIHNVY